MKDVISTEDINNNTDNKRFIRLLYTKVIIHKYFLLMIVNSYSTFRPHSFFLSQNDIFLKIPPCFPKPSLLPILSWLEALNCVRAPLNNSRPCGLSKSTTVQAVNTCNLSFLFDVKYFKCFARVPAIICWFNVAKVSNSNVG